MANPDFEVAAINDLTDAKTLAHLLKYDSNYGPFPGTVEAGDNSIIVDSKEIKFTAERNPSDLKWGHFGAGLVLEAPAVFSTREDAQLHNDAGA
mgnify:CR=1 FL=1